MKTHIASSHSTIKHIQSTMKGINRCGTLMIAMVIWFYASIRRAHHPPGCTSPGEWWSRVAPANVGFSAGPMQWLVVYSSHGSMASMLQGCRKCTNLFPGGRTSSYTWSCHRRPKGSIYSILYSNRIISPVCHLILVVPLDTVLRNGYDLAGMTSSWLQPELLFGTPPWWIYWFILVG